MKFMNSPSLLMRHVLFCLIILPAIVQAQAYDIVINMGNACCFGSIVLDGTDLSQEDASSRVIEFGSVIDDDLWGQPSSMQFVDSPMVVFAYGVKKIIDKLDINVSDEKTCRVFVGIAGYDYYKNNDAPSIDPSNLEDFARQLLGGVTFSELPKSSKEQYFKGAMQKVLQKYGFSLSEEDAFWMGGDQIIPGRIAQLFVGGGKDARVKMAANVDFFHAASCGVPYMIREGDNPQALKNSPALPGTSGGTWQVGGDVTEKYLNGLFYDEDGSEKSNIQDVVAYRKIVANDQLKGAALTRMMATHQYAKRYDVSSSRKKVFDLFLQRLAGSGTWKFNEAGYVVCDIATLGATVCTRGHDGIEFTDEEAISGQELAKQVVSKAIEANIRTINHSYKLGASGYKPLPDENQVKLVIAGEFACVLDSMMEELLGGCSQEKLDDAHSARLKVVGRQEFLKYFAQAGKYEMDIREMPPQEDDED